MKELIEFAEQNGFEISSVTLDGNIHRLDRNGKQNAWYVGYQVFSPKTGDTIPICTFGDWKTNEKFLFKPKKRYSKEDNAIIQMKVRESQTKLELERERNAEKAAQIAQEKWAAALPQGVHPYLKSKGLGNLYGARIAGEELLIKCENVDGDIVGIQRIFSDGKKRFQYGQRLKGCFGKITVDDDMRKIFICEGFATGATIHAATGQTVVIAFNCTNMIPVAKTIRQKYPNASITICGDDDAWTDGNPGRASAIEAANKVQADTKFPTFKNRDTKPTDFNDMANLDGIESVRSILKTAKSDAGFMALGEFEGAYFFYVFEHRKIVKMSSFSNVQFYGLMTKEYWESAFPPKSATAKSAVDWNEAQNYLIRLCEKVGMFDPFRIRGTGVWKDSKNVVVNTGTDIYVNGQNMTGSPVINRNVYIKTARNIPNPHRKPLTVIEGGQLIEACEAFKWKDPSSSFVLAGWLAIARLAGALAIRPHIWLTGSAATGKSTCLEELIKPALGDPVGSLQAQGGTTEAGIRQTVAANAIPIIFDEFERTRGQDERIDAIIELLRNTWSETTGSIVKGSGTGLSAQYRLAFCALVSSIRITLSNDADKSRFCILELNRHGNDRNQYRELLKRLNPIDEEFGERLFSRSIGLQLEIRNSFDLIRYELTSLRNSRFAQQYGMLLAGYHSLTSDKTITRQETEVLCRSFLDIAVETDNGADELDCLDHLLTSTVKFKGADLGQRDIPIIEIINMPSDSYRKELHRYGISVESDGILIANEYTGLKRIFANTRWSDAWGTSLSRIDGAIVVRRRVFEGRRKRSILIPFEALVESK